MALIPRCKCNQIDWSKGPKEYRYISTGELYDPFIGYEETVRRRPGVVVGCQEAVNANLMSLQEYNTTCKYIPGARDSNFPEEVYNNLLEGNYSSS